MALNPDVFAGDILREQYRWQMDEHARLAQRAREMRDDLERIEAKQRTAAERATSIMETLARYGGMLPPEEQQS
jgi:exonuclease I